MSAPRSDDRGLRNPSAERLPGRRALYRGRRRGVAVAGLAAVAALALVLGFALASAGSHPHHRGPGAPRGAGRTPLARRRPSASRTRAALVAAELATNRRILSYTSYIAQGVPRVRAVALTFDDGPGPYTAPILATLERLHVKATFFEIGREVRTYPALTARLARAGMVIGDHTETHPPMARLSRADQAIELDEAAHAIEAAGAPQPLLFRPPYGSFDSTTLGLTRARAMVMVLWTVDTSDYARPGVGRIVYTAISGARPGAILLFHDGGGDRSQTVAALPRIVARLRQRGYRIVTVPELLREDPPPAGQPPPVSLSGD